MKKCNTCNIEKELSEFRRDKRLKDGHQSSCKKCVSERIKLAYPSKYKKQRTSYYKDRRDSNKIRLQEYKIGKSCACCDETDPVVFDFHHINAVDKENTVSSLSGNGTKWERVLLEIKKCVILCANCHRKVHLSNLQIPK